MRVFANQPEGVSYAQADEPGPSAQEGSAPAPGRGVGRTLVAAASRMVPAGSTLRHDEGGGRRNRSIEFSRGFRRPQWPRRWVKRLSSGATRSWARFARSSSGRPTARARSCSRARPGSARPCCGRPASRRRSGVSAGFLRTGASRVEASLSFAGLSDVLDGVVEEVAPSLLPPRRRALEVALLMTEPGAEAPDQRAIGLAVRDVLHLLAERRPVVVALDDLQWLDPSSGIVLRIALRRLRSERVGLLASRRHAAETTAGVELERSLSGGAHRACLARADQPCRAPQPAQAATRPRADAAGARPRRASHGGESVLRARAGS